MSELLKLSIPNGSETIELESAIILSNYSITENYHNDLSPVDNSAKFTIPYDSTIATDLKTHGDEDITAQIVDGDTVVFTGYLRKTYSFTKTTRNQPISLEIVSPSTLLDVELGVNVKKESQSLYQLIDYLLQTIGFNSSSLAMSEYVFNDASQTALEKVYDLAIFDEDDNVYDLIKELCFEAGCTFNFDNEGKLKVYPLFDEPGTITQTFTDYNMKDSVVLSKEEETADNVTGIWHEKQFVEDTLIFSDTQNATDDDECEITVAAGDYLFDEETNLCEYDSTLGDVLWADTAELKVSGDVSSSEITQENKNTYYSVSYQNTSSKAKTITQFDIYGDAWIELEAENDTKAATGSNTKEFELTYLNSEEDVEEWVQNMLNYYQYADFTATVKSTADYAVGTFVTLTTEGIGTITARIIQKKTVPGENYEYKLEAISEYSSASLVTVTRRQSSSDSSVVKLINNTSATVSNLLNTQLLQIYCESATAPSKPTSDAVYTFASNTLEFSGTESWSLTRPSNPTYQVYVSYATAKAQASTDTITADEWTEPVVEGSSGENGYNVSTVSLYMRQTSTPSSDQMPTAMTYDFTTNEFTPESGLNGWSRSVPSVTISGVVYEIHSTLISNSTTVDVSADAWSDPVQVSTDSVTADDIKQVLEDNPSLLASDPVVYADANTIVFNVNTKHKVTVNQSASFTIHVIQTGEELEFTFGTITCPDGISYKTDYHTITFTAAAGYTLSADTLSIPITYRSYKSNYVYAADDNGDEIYTDENNESYGYYIYNDDDTKYTLPLTIELNDSGAYLGTVASVSEIEALEGLNIGDYVTFTGDTVESELTETGKFVKSNVYTYCGADATYVWETDTDQEHFQTASSDIWAINDEELESNNSTAHDYLAALTVNTVFADLILANTLKAKFAEIDELVATKTTITDLEATAIVLASGGSISSSNYKSGSAGFIINNDGSAEFNSVTINGYATDSELSSVSSTASSAASTASTASANASTALTALNSSGIGTGSSTVTVIKGGYISTGLVHADSIEAGSITADCLDADSIYGEEITVGNLIKSSNYDDADGFCLKADGSAIFNNSSVFRGSFNNTVLKTDAPDTINTLNYSGVIKSCPAIEYTGNTATDTSGLFYKEAILKYLDSSRAVKISYYWLCTGTYESDPVYNAATNHWTCSQDWVITVSGYIYDTPDVYSKVYWYNIPTLDYVSGLYQMYVDDDGYLKLNITGS